MILNTIYVVALIMTPVSAILNGWALSKLWEWFVVPPFDLPSLSIPEAIGVALIVSYLTFFHVDAEPNSSDDNSKALQSIYRSVLAPVFAVAIGWVVQMFL